MQQIRRRYLAGINSVKAVHASKDILIEKVNKQWKIIKSKNKIISNIREQLQKKIEKEEVEVSDKIAHVVHTVAKNAENIDISNFHPIFQELIQSYSGKPNGIRYHLM